MDIAQLSFAIDGQITVIFTDGTTKVFSEAPVVGDGDVEVDIITASGEKKTFVPKQ